MPVQDVERRGGKPESPTPPWFVYILRCSDGTLYTGITTDVARRGQQHDAGTASRYTRSRRPVRVEHQESCDTRRSALIREATIKAMSRREKEGLIRSVA
jgi:putative endonuclease